MPMDPYQEILEKAFNRKIPINAQIELTYRCNLNCVHCYATDRALKDELTTEEVEHVLKQLAEMGCLFLSLTGGEIFLRTDLMKILKMAKDNNLAVNLFTNGTLMTPAMVSELERTPPLCLHISLYAMNPDIHDRVTGTAGSHAKTVSAIKLCRKQGLNVAIKTPLLKYNLREVHALEAFASETGSSFVFDFVLAPADNGSMPMQQHGLSEKEIEDFIVTNAKPGTITGRKPEMSEQLCGAGSSTLCITPRGDVLPCLAIRQSAGNIRQDSLKSIWQSSNLDQLRNLRYSNLQDCRNCEYLGYCSRCSGIALSECGNVAGKCECACIVAKATRQASKRLGRL